MSVYFARTLSEYKSIETLLNHIHRVATDVKIDVLKVPTNLEELVLTCIKEPLTVAYWIKLLLESNMDYSIDQSIDEFKRCIMDTPWLDAPEAVWNSFITYLNFSMEELSLYMGNQRYDQEDYKSAYDFYHRVIKQMTQAIPDNQEDYIKKDIQLATLTQLLPDEKMEIYSKALSNMGIIHLMIDDAQEGINKLEIAYQLYPCNRILISLLRSKVEFLKLDPKSIVLSFLPQLLEDRDETILGFLVWFFHECGEEEESITSYLQLHSKPYKLLYIKQYIIYMVNSNQIVAMKHTLEEIIYEYPVYFYFHFIQTLVELERHELAFEAFQQIDAMTWFQGTLCYENLNQSIYLESVNQWDGPRNWQKIQQKSKVTHQYESFKFPIISKSSFLLLRSIVYYNQNQVIQGINYINQIYVEDLTTTERLEYHLHLSRLTKRNSHDVVEHLHERVILGELQKNYRHIFLSIRSI